MVDGECKGEKTHNDSVEIGNELLQVLFCTLQLGAEVVRILHDFDN